MSTPAISEHVREMPVGPMDYNEILSDKIEFFTEEGDEQQMTLHAAVMRGEAIATALKERVKKFVERSYIERDFVTENQDAGVELVNQYERLCILVETVKTAVSDFARMKEQYDNSLDKKIVGSYPVMDHLGALMTQHTFEQFVSKIQNDYLTPGKVNTYLVDRIGNLKQLLSKV